MQKIPKTMQPDSANVFQIALMCLLECDIKKKLEMTRAFYADLQNRQIVLGAKCTSVEKVAIPGRPAKPELIDGKHVPRRAIGSMSGRQALLHALAHIEFNAINLGLDAVYRFQKMPTQFVLDWAQIASEEAYHFSLLATRMDELGCFYGELPAHNGLWDMAVRTDYDVMVRMALVPRVLEARGLDVAPKMIEKLRHVGDARSADILEIIYQDEIGHVKIGNYWFRYLCQQRNLNLEETFAELVQTHNQGFIRGPFNYDARKQAGFSDAELQVLELSNAKA